SLVLTPSLLRAYTIVYSSSCSPSLFFFFFNHTATTQIYTLSLHDALPISHFGSQGLVGKSHRRVLAEGDQELQIVLYKTVCGRRSEEHTSELQSPDHLVCRLLLEKKKKKKQNSSYNSNS